MAKKIPYLEVKKQLPFLIPEQYNDAMSYQELLYAVIDVVNEQIEEINKIPSEISSALDSEIITEKINTILEEKLATWWTETGIVSETDRRNNFNYFKASINYFTKLLMNQYFTEQGEPVNYVNVSNIAGASSIVTLADIEDVAKSYSFGALSNFKFAYRTNGEKFTATQLIQECIKEKQVTKNYDWVYVTDSPDYKPGQFSTIPLYNVDNPAEVLSPNGKGTSCATAICNMLYRLGYSGLKGDARYTESRVFDYSLPYFLEKNNFIKIEKKEDLQPGDIVFVNDCLYADERRFNPSHEFVYAGNDLSYDWGNTALVQNGGTNTIDWTLTLGDQILGTWYNSIFSHIAQLNNSHIQGGNPSKWMGVKTVYDDGARTLLYNPDSLKFAEYEQNFGSDNRITKQIIEYPLTKTNSWKGGTVAVSINYDGTIRLKIYGTLTEQLRSAVTDYTIFSFSTFTEKTELKYINSVFTKYFMLNENTAAKLWTTQTTVGENTVTLLHMKVYADVEIGTELNVYEILYKN